MRKLGIKFPALIDEISNPTEEAYTGWPDRLYLIEGTPGTGKTTLALQFLLEGSKKGETGLYVTLSESEKELGVVAARHTSGSSQRHAYRLAL